MRTFSRYRRISVRLNYYSWGVQVRSFCTSNRGPSENIYPKRHPRCNISPYELRARNFTFLTEKRERERFHLRVAKIGSRDIQPPRRDNNFLCFAFLCTSLLWFPSTGVPTGVRFVLFKRTLRLPRINVKRLVTALFFTL